MTDENVRKLLSNLKEKVYNSEHYDVITTNRSKGKSHRLELIIIDKVDDITINLCLVDEDNAKCEFFVRIFSRTSMSNKVPYRDKLKLPKELFLAFRDYLLALNEKDKMTIEEMAINSFKLGEE